MKSLEITFGTSLAEIKEIAKKEFGTLRGVYLSTFNNHYRGNSIGNIFPIEKEYPYTFHWHTSYEDRGIERAYLIMGNITEMLAERKKMTDSIKAVIQPSSRVKLKYQVIDGRWKKSRIAEIIENNKQYKLAIEKATEYFYAEIEELSKNLNESVFGLISSRQIILDI